MVTLSESIREQWWGFTHSTLVWPLIFLALGDIRREQGRFEEACGHVESSLATFRKLRCRDLEARALDSLCGLAGGVGDLP
jgi:hypothetical protein